MGLSPTQVRSLSPERWNGREAGKILYATVSPVGFLQGDIVVTKDIEYRSNAFIAQWIERFATDEEVGGSNPSEGTGRNAKRFIG